MIRVGMLLSPQFQMLASFAPLSVFEVANLMLPEPRYELHVVSEKGGRVRDSLGVGVTTERAGDLRFDTLLVGAGTCVQPVTPGVVALLQSAVRSTRRVGSICVAAFSLAQAGLLDGRRATTHWAYSTQLQQHYPKVAVEMDRIFIADGRVWTSAGMTAGIDLALGMVEQDLGHETARKVAKAMVLYHRRAGGQSQHSALLDLSPTSDRVQQAITFARANLAKPLTVIDLADAVGLSPRQFSRVFRVATGVSPAKAVENLRLEAARLLMEQGRLTVAAVAKETGFGQRERMRRAFVRAFDQTPQEIRRAAKPLALA
jgi:transcriptional regulator GlxA family with amidase domain